MNDLINGLKKLLIFMSSMAGSKVSKIITSLNALEEDLDSLNEKVAGMKKQLVIKVQSEITTMLEKSREMAIKEADKIIEASKQKAATQSQEITKEAEARLAESQSRIEANFDDAVGYVVTTVLKA